MAFKFAHDRYLCDRCNEVRPRSAFPALKYAHNDKGVCGAVCKFCNKNTYKGPPPTLAERATRKEIRKLSTSHKNIRTAYIKQATPAWADRRYIKLFYVLAKAEADRIGEPVEVDHIIPIRGKIVCGLHCERNLQLLTRKANQFKENVLWEF